MIFFNDLEEWCDDCYSFQLVLVMRQQIQRAHGRLGSRHLLFFFLFGHASVCCCTAVRRPLLCLFKNTVSVLSGLQQLCEETQMPSAHRIFPDQVSNLCLLHLAEDSFTAEPPGNLKALGFLMFFFNAREKTGRLNIKLIMNFSVA